MTEEKILYVSDSKDTGVECFYTATLAEHFSANNSVLVLALEKSPLEQELVKLNIHTADPEFPDEESGYSSRLQFYLSMKDFIKKAAPTIVHVNDSLNGCIVALAAHAVKTSEKSGDIRLIYTVHQDESVESAFLNSYFRKRAIRSADMLIVPDISLKRSVSKIAKPDSHIAIIPYGMSAQNPPTPRTSKEKLLAYTRLSGALNLWSNVTLWLGTYVTADSNEYVSTLLSVIANLQPRFREHKVSIVVFLLCDTKETAEHVQKSIDQQKLSSSVFATEKQAEAEQYLSGFDIFLLPETMPNPHFKILQIGASEICVIVSEKHHLDGTVKNDISGLILDNFTEPLLEKAVLELARSLEKRNTLSENLYKKVQSMTTTSMMTKTERAYTLSFETRDQ